MSDKPAVDELELSDAELIEVLKNHGINRRLLMKAFGVGAGVAALGGTATGAGGGNSSARIDKNFGAPFSVDDKVPPGLVDHVVDLDFLPGPAGEHDGFPDPNDTTPEFRFDPVGLNVRPGDVVQFEVSGGGHTVTSFHEKFHFPGFDWENRVPTEHGFTSPGDIVNHNGAESWLYRFTTNGIYDLFCFPHLPLGMVMRIVVSDRNEDGSTFTANGGLSTDATGNPSAVLTDPELDPTNIVDKGDVGWDELNL